MTVSNKEPQQAEPERAAPPPYADGDAAPERTAPHSQESERHVQWRGGGGGAPDAPLFVQLSELEEGEEEGDSVWREAARWIKYEEDVEAEAGRWGRPHVAALELGALLELRRRLGAGCVLLDVPARDLAGAARALATAAPVPLPALLQALSRPHAHLLDDSRSLSLHRLSRASLQWERSAGRGARGSLPAPPRPGAAPAPAPAPAPRRHSAAPATRLVPLLLAGSEERRRRRSSRLEALGEALAPRNEALLRRIPAGAEVAAALAGAVRGLERPVVALLRLATAAAMPQLTAVPLPVRFLFVVLEPRSADPEDAVRRRELGRCMGTLLSDPAFHATAFRASRPDHLLEAIDDFFDEAIVMPRGDWQRSDLLPLSDLRARSEGLRRRKLSLRPEPAQTLAPPPADKRALLAAESALPWAPPDDPLSRTGRLFGGVVRDMRRRYPHYLSDFRDGLNGQCVAAAIFMYFAALSSAITFGGLLSDKTHGLIGISETLVFTSLGGVVFALVAGQPMMITGATGPLLLLDESLAAFCRAYELDFLAARMFAGFWMLIIALVVAALEGSVAVKKITRFTEDIFAFLISLIFISEPITATLATYRKHPLGADYCVNCTANNSTLTANSTLASNATLVANSTLSANSTVVALLDPRGPQPNTALWCTMLTLATFTIAYYLRIFRNGKILGRGARRALGDFGVPIAIVVMVGAATLVPVYTDTLRVPEGLSPTAPRPWLVPLAGASLPPLAAAAMLLPALMVYIIVFMETHIAELIVDKPERKLAKGSGFHMDVVVMSAVNCVCGLFGAPWQCVATVRSVSHVAALTVMSTTHAPGDKPHIEHVKEQRLTGLAVAVLVGASVAGARWLRLVPMAVLFGVFLYMGISALAGIQLWDRLLLLLKPVKHHPPVPYVKRVPTARMHVFTCVQFAGLALLYLVKASPASLALPFFLVCMVPLRMSLVRWFTPAQLRALDGAQKEIDDDDEPDFYQEAPLPG